MVREDIVAGLRNAVEKGESLEKAKQSFISAGYPHQEVEEAASLIHSGSVLLIEKEGNFPPLKMQTSPQPTQQVEMPKEDKPISTKLRRNFKIILLIIILLILVGILIVTLVFREKIIALFS